VGQHPTTGAEAARTRLWGLGLALAGSIAFSGKAIIVKLAYRHGVDAVTLIMYRMLFALPLFVALAWWAGRGKAPLTRATAGDRRPGLQRLLPGQLSGLCRPAVRQRQPGALILYLNPTLVLLAGCAAFKHRVSARSWWPWRSAMAACCWSSATKRASRAATRCWGGALVFGSAVSYAVYLVYSGELVRAWARCGSPGWATSVASLLCIAQFLLLRPLSAAVVAPEVMWLSVLNATLCTFAPVLMVMMAIERSARR
jgi:drug/metabolite transporter (DMT)-like permease